jgi:hypothetical protein
VTDLAAAPVLSPTAFRWRLGPALAAGGLGGCALGVFARGWMRLIAEDPDFTWGGTIFIVGAFTAFGLGQAGAAFARRRCLRRWKLTVARAIGVVTMLPLFVGAGSLMLPTVVGAGLAVARTRWYSVVRVACAVVASGPVLFVAYDLYDSFGLSPRSLAGAALIAATYATIVWATRFTFAAHGSGSGGSAPDAGSMRSVQAPATGPD